MARTRSSKQNARLVEKVSRVFEDVRLTVAAFVDIEFYIPTTRTDERYSQCGSLVSYLPKNCELLPQSCGALPKTPMISHQTGTYTIVETALKQSVSDVSEVR